MARAATTAAEAGAGRTERARRRVHHPHPSRSQARSTDLPWRVRPRCNTTGYGVGNRSFCTPHAQKRLDPLGLCVPCTVRPRCRPGRGRIAPHAHIGVLRRAALGRPLDFGHGRPAAVRRGSPPPDRQGQVRARDVADAPRSGRAGAHRRRRLRPPHRRRRARPGGHRRSRPTLIATRASGVPLLYRVGANEPVRIMHALDAGASGVVVPQIRTVADAERAVAWCRDPPAGRGASRHGARPATAGQPPRTWRRRMRSSRAASRSRRRKPWRTSTRSWPCRGSTRSSSARMTWPPRSGTSAT